MPIDMKKYAQALEMQRLQATIRLQEADEQITAGKAKRRQAEADLNSVRGAQQLATVISAEQDQQEAAVNVPSATAAPQYQPRVGTDEGTKPPRSAEPA